MSWPPETMLYIPTQWRIRNDVNNLVAYTYAEGDLKYSVLSPWQASVVPFFDGTNDLATVKHLWMELTGEREQTTNQRSRLFDAVIETLSRVGILSDRGPVSPALQREIHHLIPNYSRYCWPVKRLERPLGVCIGFTSRCQADCIYCYAERKATPEKNISEWCKVFDDLAANEIYVVEISGGDLLARHDWATLLSEMVARDFVFFLSTKCYVSKYAAEVLAQLHIGQTDTSPLLRRDLQISIDSADFDIASTLVRVPHRLEKALESARHLSNVGISPIIKGVLTSYNATAPKGLVEAFRKEGVTRFRFSFYDRSYYCHNDQLFVSEQEKAKVRRDCGELQVRYPECDIALQGAGSVEGSEEPLNDNWHNRALCSGGRVYLQFKSNGDVTLCERVPHNESFVVGNVFSEDVVSIWHSRKLMDFIYPDRQQFEQTVCFACPDFDECHEGKGYCFLDSYFHFGSVFDAPPECPRQRKVPLRMR
jgi:radical SAM protein with 4Fe4S-binding SPASM domain